MLLMYDSVFIATDTGLNDYLNNFRNKMLSPMQDSALPNFPAASQSEPDKRYFNAALGELGPFAMEADTPPRPGAEPPYSATPDLMPANSPQDGLFYAARYSNDTLQGDTKQVVRFSERIALAAYVEGIKTAGMGPRSWYTGRSEAHLTQIWQSARDFLTGILTDWSDPDGVRQDRIGGFVLPEEPESLALRRLPREKSRVCGVRSTSGNLVEGEEITLEVVADNRGYLVEWDFNGLADEGATTDFTAQETSFTPTIVCAAEGSYTLRVRVSNWWSTGDDDEWWEMELDVAAPSSTPAPVITGVYCQITRNVPEEEKSFAQDLLIQRLRSNGDGGMGTILAGAYEVAKTTFAEGPWLWHGSIARFEVCTINEVEAWLWSFPSAARTDGEKRIEPPITGEPSVSIRHGGEKNLPVSQLEPSITGVGSILATNASGGDSLEFVVRWVRPVELDTNGNPDVSKLYDPEGPNVSDYSKYCLPPRNWMNRQLLNDLAWVINDFQEWFIENDASAPGRGDTPKPLFIIHNICAIGEVFTGERDPGEGCGEFFDRPPVQEDLRLNSKPGVEEDLGEIHLFDDYPYVSTAELTSRGDTNHPLNHRQFDDPVLPFVRLLALQRRLNYHDDRYLQPISGGDPPPAGIPGTVYTPPTPLVPKDIGFWVQCWGETPTEWDETPPDDPKVASDVGPYRKPTLDQVRFQVWMAAALGCEVIGWFAQMYMADEYIETIHNVAAKEFYLYSDLRWNRIKRGWRSDRGGFTPPAGTYVTWSATDFNRANSNAYPTWLPSIVDWLERDQTLDTEDPRGFFRLGGEQFLLMINPSNQMTTYTLQGTWRLRGWLDTNTKVILTPHKDGIIDFDLQDEIREWSINSSGGFDPLTIMLEPYEVRIYHVSAGV